MWGKEYGLGEWAGERSKDGTERTKTLRALFNCYSSCLGDISSHTASVYLPCLFTFFLRSRATISKTHRYRHYHLA